MKTFERFWLASILGILTLLGPQAGHSKTTENIVKPRFVTNSVPQTSHAKTTEPLVHYYGRAFELHSNQLVYQEEYQENLDENRHRSTLVIYQDAESKTIAQKTISFHKNPLIPEFNMKDYRNGGMEGITLSEERLTMFWRKDSQAALTTKEIPIPEMGVADAGVHYFIQKHWEVLQNGEPLELNLIVAAELDYFAFQIKKIKQGQWNNQAVVVYQLEVANLLLRWFIDPILLTYQAQTQQLLVYEGISNIKNVQGENFFVKILIEHF